MLYHSINPNDDTSPFIGKIRITSCEIPKLSLTCSPNFAGKEASKLNHFQTGLSSSRLDCSQAASTKHIGFAIECSPIRCFKVNFSSGDSTTRKVLLLHRCHQPETSNLPNAMTRKAPPSLRDYRVDCVK